MKTKKLLLKAIELRRQTVVNEAIKRSVLRMDNIPTDTHSHIDFATDIVSDMINIANELKALKKMKEFYKPKPEFAKDGIVTGSPMQYGRISPIKFYDPEKPYVKNPLNK